MKKAGFLFFYSSDKKKTKIEWMNEMWTFQQKQKSTKNAGKNTAHFCIKNHQILAFRRMNFTSEKINTSIFFLTMRGHEMIEWPMSFAKSHMETDV